MRPYSRGTLPVEFSLRVHCALDESFIPEETPVPLGFELLGVQCTARQENHGVLITATNFQTQAEAERFFSALQRQLATYALNARIPLSVPKDLLRPVEQEVSFIPGSDACIEQGWPHKSIRPLLIDALGASVYPEHEYVAIAEIYRILPHFPYSVGSFVEGMSTTSQQSQLVDAAVDEILLLAIAGYTHAARSFQSIWSFLLAVMMLEMLAEEPPASDETITAVDALLKQAEVVYGGTTTIDLDQIRAGLMRAKVTTSKVAAVRDLIAKYCAPGISAFPLSHLYSDTADCRKKVGHMYEIRSTYVHSGRISADKKVKYSFADTHAFALESLGHILKLKLTRGDADRSVPSH